MRKHLILTVLMVLILSGCAGQKKEVVQEGATTTATPAESGMTHIPTTIPATETPESVSTSAEDQSMKKGNTISIPKPEKVESKYLTGAYYWISWNTVETLTPYMDWNDSIFQPLLGRYDSTNTTAINWHIKWAVEHGISFFAVQFYETQLKSGFMNAEFLPYIRFCFIAPYELSIAEDEDRIVRQFDWMSEYFDHPQYLKIDDKPVVFLLVRLNQFDDEEKSALLSKIKKAKSYIEGKEMDVYLIGTYTIGDGNFSKTDQKLNREFDAITMYSMPEAGGKTTSYDSMVLAYISLTQEWAKGAEEAGVDFIPNAIPGFNDTLSYEHGTRSWLVVRKDATPEKFKQMVEGVSKYTSPNINMLMITAWNEFAEGSAIEPTEENGFAYLEALKDVVQASNA